MKFCTVATTKNSLQIPKSQISVAATLSLEESLFCDTEIIKKKFHLFLKEMENITSLRNDKLTKNKNKKNLC